MCINYIIKCINYIIKINIFIYIYTSLYVYHNLLFLIIYCIN